MHHRPASFTQKCWLSFETMILKLLHTYVDIARSLIPKQHNFVRNFIKLHSLKIVIDFISVVCGILSVLCTVPVSWGGHVHPHLEDIKDKWSKPKWFAHANYVLKGDNSPRFWLATLCYEFTLALFRSIRNKQCILIKNWYFKIWIKNIPYHTHSTVSQSCCSTYFENMSAF